MDPGAIMFYYYPVNCHCVPEQDTFTFGLFAYNEVCELVSGSCKWLCDGNI